MTSGPLAITEQARARYDLHQQGRRAKHQQHTQEIIRLETELNQRVYDLFELTPAEIKIIEDSTKYRYGET